MGKHDPDPGFTEWFDGLRARLKEIRESQGLSFREAEAKTTVTFSSIQRLEAGRVEPSPSLLYTIAAGYGVPFEQVLVGGKAIVISDGVARLLAEVAAEQGVTVAELVEKPLRSIATGLRVTTEGKKPATGKRARAGKSAR